VFTLLLASDSNDGARAFARIKIAPRLHYLNARLAGRDYLLDRFTVVDAYLATVFNWCQFTGIDLAQWSAIAAYLSRVRQRPNVARALAEEHALYQAEQVRRAA
jgi:glutathione S-transferase